MSMHLRGSRDMMGRDESWWQSRTGLEQKLVILSTILFILSFSLTISVIVIKNRTTSGGSDATTISPTESTTVSGETPVTEPSSPITESTKEEPATSEPTTEPKTEPTTEPTTAPTTELTTAPTTEPTTEITTIPSPKPPAESEVEASGPGSINSRPARYIPSPKVLANVHGEVLGA